MKAFFLTMGRYDLVGIVSFPDDEAAAKASLWHGSQGNVRVETLPAFGPDEYRRIISGLP